MDFLPLVLLGRSTALQPDIGASPCEMIFGENVKIPGQLLTDLSDKDTLTSLQELLIETKKKTSRPISQPSRHCPPEVPLPDIPDGITHVYTRQHQKTGLDTPFQGPFRLVERLSRSTVKIEVGIYKNGEKRYEVRHLNDLRLAHPESLAAPISRPKLGRPSSSSKTSNATEAKTPVPDSSNQLTDNRSKQTSTGGAGAVGNNKNDNHETSNPNCRQPASAADARPVRSTRNPSPSYVDAVQWSPRPWSASPGEIAALNAAIGS